MKEEKNIELDQSDFKENKQARKSGSGLGLKLTCGFLALATLGLGAFVVYDKFFATQPEKTETSASNQTLVEEKNKISENSVYVYNTDEQELYDLFAKYIPDGFCGDGLEYSAQYTENLLLGAKSTTLDTSAKKDIAEAIFWSLANSENNLEQKYKDTFDSYFTKTQLESMKVKLFGNDFKYDVSKIGDDLGSAMVWDDDLQVLHFPTGWGGTCPTFNINTRIVKAQKTGKNIEVFVRRLGKDEKGFYKFKAGQKQYLEKDAPGTTFVEGINLDLYVLTASDMRKGNLYKVTFEQDPDDSKNFIFKSSEILE